MFVEVKNFEALRAAMKQLCDFLEERDVPEDSVFDSKLVVSELVSNVLQHSDGAAFLEGEIRGNFIELVLPAGRKPLFGRICRKRPRTVYRGQRMYRAFLYGGRGNKSTD